MRSSHGDLPSILEPIPLPLRPKIRSAETKERARPRPRALRCTHQSIEQSDVVSLFQSRSRQVRIPRKALAPIFQIQVLHKVHTPALRQLVPPNCSAGIAAQQPCGSASRSWKNSGGKLWHKATMRHLPTRGFSSSLMREGEFPSCCSGVR